MLIVHFIGVAMTAGTAFAHLFLGRIGKNIGGEQGGHFALHAFSLNRMGNIGLILLFLSGGYLMTPYWKTLGETPLLMVKLLLFLVIGALFGIMSAKAKKAKSGDTSQLGSLNTLSIITFITGILTILMAVLVFH